MRSIIVFCLMLAAFPSLAAISTSVIGTPVFSTQAQNNATPPSGTSVFGPSQYDSPPAGSVTTSVPPGSTIADVKVQDAANQAMRFAAGENVQGADTTPPGWTDAVTPPTSYTTTLTYSTNANVGGTTLGQESTFSAACTDFVNAMNGSRSYPCTAGTCQSGSSDASHCYYGVPPGNINYYSLLITGSYKCNTGYTASGSTCNLTGQAKWASDNVPTMTYGMSGGVLVWNPSAYDPDNTGLTPTQRFERTGTDSFGNPVHEDVSPNADGGIDYERDVQSPNPTTGQPVTTTDKVSTTNAGIVTSSTTNITNNTTINNLPTVTGSGAGVSGSVTFDKSGLATSDNQTSIITALAQVHSDLTSDGTSLPTLDTVRDFSASTALVINKWQTEFVIPTFDFSGVSCPTWTQHIPFLDTDLTIDQWCTMDDTRIEIQSIADVIWMFLGFLIVMSA